MSEQVENADLGLKKAQKLAIIMPATEKALLTGAIIFIRDELLKNFPNFNVEEDLFLCNAHDLHKPDLGFCDKIIVIDPENKFLKPERFISKNWQARKKISWYLGSKTQKQKIQFLKDFFGSKNVHDCQAEKLLEWESKNKKVKDEMIRLSRSLDFVERGKSRELAPRQLERIKKAIYVAKFKDRERSSAPILLQTTMQQLFSELVLKRDAPLIVDLMVDFQLLKEAERKAKRTKIEHPVLGKLKLVKPKKGAKIEIKSFFENGFHLGYQAVAVRSAKGEYELCLRNDLAKKIANEIPAIKKINDCRFIVAKEFLITEPVE